MSDDSQSVPDPIPTAPEALRRWIVEHDVYEIECYVPDHAGVAKGKVMPAMKFAEFKPLMLPITLFQQGITGAYAEIEGLYA